MITLLNKTYDPSIMNRIVKHLLLMLLASVTLAIIIHLVKSNYGYPADRAFGFVFVYLLALMAVPLVIGGIPTLIIYASRKRIWNNFYAIIWVVWIIFGTLLSLESILGGA